MGARPLGMTFAGGPQAGSDFVDDGVVEPLEQEDIISEIVRMQVEGVGLIHVDTLVSRVAHLHLAPEPLALGLVHELLDEGELLCVASYVGYAGDEEDMMTQITKLDRLP